MLAPMHLAELTPPEQRVLGCLIEKRWTTPDQYPLSLNGLRLACNQSTNRDPVTTYDEATVRDAAQRLCLYGLARLASGHGSRATKYRHLAEEALRLDREELAVLAVLLLRGPQTPGELKARTERMAPLASLADVERILTTLGEREYARRIGRRPGQKEDRFEHLLGPWEGSDASWHAQAPPTPAPTAPAAQPGPTPAPTVPPAAQPGPTPAPTVPPAAQPGPPPAPAGQPPSGTPPAQAGTPPAQNPVDVPSELNGRLADRVAALEAEVAALREELDELRDQLTMPAAN
jgi:uncharacterized protein